LFGVLDHRQADAILDAAAGIGPFQLHPDFDVAISEQPVDADVGGIANGFQEWSSLSLHSLSNVAGKSRV
jgi:hypothetical protein